MKIRVKKEIIANLLGLAEDFKLIGAEVDGCLDRQFLCIEFETSKLEFVEASERSTGSQVECVYRTVYENEKDPEQYVSRVWPGYRLFLQEVLPHD